MMQTAQKIECKLHDANHTMLQRVCELQMQDAWCELHGAMWVKLGPTEGLCCLPG
jgi:hypothetical protein